MDNKTRPVIFFIWLFVAILSIILLAIWIYYPGLSGPYILDDQANLIFKKSNTAISINDLIAATLSNRSGPLGRPISTLSFALNQCSHADGSFCYKIVNVAIHLVIGFLLFILGNQLLKNSPILQRKENTRLIAALPAIIWLLHPLHVSTVLYVVQRMTQLSTLFMVLGMIVYVSGRQRMLGNLRYGLRYIFISILLFTPLAAFSKENGLLLPAYIILIECVFFRLEADSESSRKKLIWVLGLFCVLPITIALVYQLGNLEHIRLSYASRIFTFEERIFTQPVVLLFYLRQIFIPELQSMGVFQDDFPIIQEPNLQFYLAVTLLISFITISVTLYKKQPLILLGVFWFIISHSLESSIFPLEMVFEHRNYLAIWGVFLPVAWYLHQLMHKHRLMMLTTLILSIIYVFLFATMTVLRVEKFKDTITFYSNSLENHPDSPRALLSMGVVHYELGNTDKGRELIRRAATLAPHELGFRFSEIATYCGHFETPAPLLNDLSIDLKNAPFLTPTTNAMAHNLLNKILIKKCPGVTPEQFYLLTSAALSNIEFNRVVTSNFNIYYAHAQVLLHLGRYKEATFFLKKIYQEGAGLSLQHRVDALELLAHTYIFSGDIASAKKTKDLILSLNKSPEINAGQIIENIENAMEKSGKIRTKE
ncbi:MAG: tetratricopeptide repeat protein [Candidatus Sedimenticola sp. (ex Thyasira tokunagai)]